MIDNQAEEIIILKENLSNIQEKLRNMVLDEEKR